ncbi:MAG: tol-pal system protein YbgF [Cyclobacteriaceae bacterium]|nr:tol-pal system protein YbgF [Cyclobacteriaceae bacterium]
MVSLICIISGTAYAQIDQESLDSIAFEEEKKKYLLLDIGVQIEATAGVNSMYNFKFEEAERQFRVLKYRYKEHPLPYFLMGLSNWWKIAPNIDVKEYDERFFHYMDTVIVLGEKMLDEDPDNIEANFFLAAAYGFKGRLDSERKNWTKAAFSGKKALDYLEKSKGQHEFSPEFMFGDALFNYYSVWVPENYPMLKPILAFFPKGDKEVGMQQLRTVANNAFYTRTEAQYFLMRIMALDEKDTRSALNLSSYLHKTFPDNSYFHRFYARLLYTTGNYTHCKQVSESIITKIDEGYTGYGPVTGRYAAFFLGQINQVYGNKQEAIENYKRAVEFGEQAEAEDSGYYLYSLFYLAQLLDKEKRFDESESYLKLIRKNAKRKHPAHKRARQYMKDRKELVKNG